MWRRRDPGGNDLSSLSAGEPAPKQSHGVERGRDCSVPYLIVALSGRGLAASAQRSGVPVCVVDLFNDLDTRGYAQRCARAAVLGGGFSAFDPSALVRCVEENFPPQACAGIVPGAGFEEQPELLRCISAGRTLFGNRPEIVALVKQPSLFFPLLVRVGLAHPQVRLDIPERPEGWLAKRIGASGGGHVQNAVTFPNSSTELEQWYFQRFTTGRPCSSLFLADGKRALLVGSSEQWGKAAHAGDFSYAGAISVSLPATVQIELTRKLTCLVEATGLTGLNGIDFLLRGEEFFILEVNPRPSATLDLHDGNFEQGLFALHLQACQGNLSKAQRPDADAGANIARAHAVVYAPAWTRIAPRFSFPAWCSDVPASGSLIAPGAPVCMVHANGSDRHATLRQLAQRARLIDRELSRPEESRMVAR